MKKSILALAAGLTLCPESGMAAIIYNNSPLTFNVVAPDTQGARSSTTGFRIGNSGSDNMSVYIMSQKAIGGDQFFQYANVNSLGVIIRNGPDFSFTPYITFTSPVLHNSTIDSSLAFNSSVLTDSQSSSNLNYPSGTYYYGLKLANNNNYGWISFSDVGSSVGNNYVTINWAYDDNGNSITVGQTVASVPVPEPTAFIPAMLICVGVLMRRRRGRAHRSGGAVA